MSRYLRFLMPSIMAVFSAHTFAHQPIVTVEGAALQPVTTAVSNIIASDPSFAELKELNCKLVGQPVRLSDTPEQLGLFVTTGNACGWGAALAPIWIVLNASTGERMVLSAGGYSFTTQDQISHDHFDISIDGGSARAVEVSLYRFDGKRYGLIKRFEK